MSDQAKFQAVVTSDLLMMATALSGIDWTQVVADIKAGKPEVIIGDILLIAQVGTKDAGYFIPEAATASQWIGLVRAVYPALVQGVELANALAPEEALKPNEISVWGSTVDNPNN